MNFLVKITFVSLAFPGRYGVYIRCGRDGHPVCAVFRSASQYPRLHWSNVGARSHYLQPLQVGGWNAKCSWCPYIYLVFNASAILINIV